MSEENGNILDFGSIDFTPAWAKKGAGVSVGKIRPESDGAREAGRGDRPRKPLDARDGRKPRSEMRPFGGDRKAFGDRKPFGGRKPSGDRPRFEERPRPLDCEVKILPETKALGTIIRKLQGDAHAYKLKELAYFFLDNPQSILLKITPRTAPTSQTSQTSQTFQTSQTSQTFFQCKACGFASTREEDVLSHALTAHLGDYYDAKVIDCEPPKGSFNCVAKCGLSGVLLGPPNIHEFNATVKEMIRTKYPNLSEDQYRAHIEMVRDPEAIEEWRKGATKKTVFFAKGQADVEGAAQMTREQAEGEFRRTILPSLLDRPKHLMITADVAQKSPVKPLVWAVNDAIQAERRTPAGMCFALRGAFHHRKLHFFRANDARGPEFVSGLEYKAFDAEHAIPELARAAKFVAEHPCCDKSEFPTDDPEFEQHLNWLVTTGHVVAFTNGVFSAVEKYPKYGPQWKKRAKVEKKAAEKSEEKPAAMPAAMPAALNAEVAEEGRRGEEEKPNPCESVKSVDQQNSDVESSANPCESVKSVDQQNSDVASSANPCASMKSVDQNSEAEEEVKKDETAPVVAE